MTVTVLWLFLTASWIGLQNVIVVFPDKLTLILSKLDNFRSGFVFGLCCGIHYFVSFLVLPSYWRGRQMLDLL